jgi:hypothetical protein
MPPNDDVALCGSGLLLAEGFMKKNWVYNGDCAKHVSFELFQDGSK